MTYERYEADDDPNRIPPTLNLVRALSMLDPLDREVWVDRRMLGRTLQSIADEWSERDPEDAPGSRAKWPNTRERIRQLERRADYKIAMILKHDPDLHAQLDDPELSERIRNYTPHTPR